MKKTPNKLAEQWRTEGTKKMGNNGAFLIPYSYGEQPEKIKTVKLQVRVSDELDWDHVSVSLPNRCPTWEEMAYVKGVFFKPHEVAIQFFMPAMKNINIHPFCLHIWRQQSVCVNLPPTFMV